MIPYARVTPPRKSTLRARLTLSRVPTYKRVDPRRESNPPTPSYPPTRAPPCTFATPLFTTSIHLRRFVLGTFSFGLPDSSTYRLLFEFPPNSHFDPPFCDTFFFHFLLLLLLSFSLYVYMCVCVCVYDVNLTY